MPMSWGLALWVLVARLPCWAPKSPRPTACRPPSLSRCPICVGHTAAARWSLKTTRLPTNKGDPGMAVKLTLPISDQAIRDLKVGDAVLLSGVMITGRDAVHKWIADTFIKKTRQP